MTKKDKVEKVMHEWKKGTLTSNGKKVTDYNQAVAIALSEAGLSKYENGGEFKSRLDFVKEVKKMHEAIDEIVLKDGTHIKGKELMEKGKFIYGSTPILKKELENNLRDLQAMNKVIAENDMPKKYLDDAMRLQARNEELIKELKHRNIKIDSILYKDYSKSTQKFAVGGEVGNTVTFSRYGERTIGRVTDKLKNGYEVATDEGTILVEPNEVISFSETPIAKKKRFGFFEGGGEIQSKIDKLNKVVNSKMLPEGVKDKARAEIEKLEKELHESKGGETLKKQKGWKFSEGEKVYIDENKINFLIKEQLKEYDLSDFYYINEGYKQKFDGKTINLYELRTKEGKVLTYIEIPEYALTKSYHESKESTPEDYVEAKIKALETRLKDKSISEVQRKRDEKELELFKKADSNKETSIKGAKHTESYYKNLPIYNDYEWYGFNNGKHLFVKKKGGKFVEIKATDEDLENGNIEFMTKNDLSNENKVVATKASISKRKIEGVKPKFKVGETVNFNNELYKILEIKKAKDLDGKGDVTWRYLLDGYSDIMIQEDLLKEYKTTAKPKLKAKKFKVGETVSIIDHPKSDKTNFYKVVGHQDWNDDYGWETTIEKAGEKVTMFENLLERSVAPKPDHKKLLAKIKAKKGEGHNDRGDLVHYKTGETERRKRSESSDKKREALPVGKRVSKDGNIYYERRANRSDSSKEDKFEGGGEIGKENSGWGLKFLKW